ncbi:MAG TPA: alkaline phosphatase PafA, partial [Bacteroidia bacterium]|nr:alkaline phosphatase PafA [Bacteroidia bacterium]
MRQLLTVFILTLSCFRLSAQQPKLVVGIVIDQMRQDYIYRYWERFGDSGFKRIINGGYMFENAHFNYVPTYTGPGHASIYTGTTPAIHGIVANDWFSREDRKSIYCVDDTTCQGVESNMGKSPRNLKTTTITDQLRLATQFRSKVVGISIKDRGAVLPAGHSANGAYWFDSKTGAFATSTFYMPELPKWMQEFNNKKLAETFVNSKWETLYPVNTYKASAPDDNNYEGRFDTSSRPVFPYNLSKLKEIRGYGILSYTPYGNTLVTEAGKAAITGEQMGKGKETDFLCLSYSSPDYAGHFFGPQAVELEDMYLRLDRELAGFFNYLDKTIGKGKWTIFITADHGGNEVPAMLADHRIPAGRIKGKEVETAIKAALKDRFGDSLVLHYENDQVYLDTAKVKVLGLDECLVQETAGKAAAVLPGIARYYTACRFTKGDIGILEVEHALYRGWNSKESGDVLLLTEPAWMEYSSPTGTTHGSPWAYDTRVPVLFYGSGIKKG